MTTEELSIEQSRMRKQNSAPIESPYFTVAQCAERWQCSTTKASKVLKLFRGQSGYFNIGQAEDSRRGKKRYEVIRIHSTLLQKIEAERKFLR